MLCPSLVILGEQTVEACYVLVMIEKGSIENRAGGSSAECFVMGCRRTNSCCTKPLRSMSKETQCLSINCVVSVVVKCGGVYERFIGEG